MNITQNQKISQITEDTLVVGVDIGSTTHLPEHSTGAVSK